MDSVLFILLTLVLRRFAGADDTRPTFAAADDSLAVDGKTLCNAIDADGRQCHVLSAGGHDSLACHAQKKSACSRAPTTR